jgi:hypothetical protein
MISVSHAVAPTRLYLVRRTYFSLGIVRAVCVSGMTQKPPFRTRDSHFVVVVRRELVLSATVSHRAAHTESGATGALAARVKAPLSHGIHATLTINLPKFRPSNIPMKARGAASRPSTMSSR